MPGDGIAIFASGETMQQLRREPIHLLGAEGSSYCPITPHLGCTIIHTHDDGIAIHTQRIKTNTTTVSGCCSCGPRALYTAL